MTNAPCCGILLVELAEANALKKTREATLMKLSMADEGKEYIIDSIATDDEELNSFLFSLGCYAGEPITVIKRRKSGSVVVIKDGRYNIDRFLCDAISVSE